MTTGFPRIHAKHSELARWWGQEAIASIKAALANPTPATREDHDLHHAVRSARIAYRHAMKAKRP